MVPFCFYRSDNKRDDKQKEGDNLSWLSVFLLAIHNRKPATASQSALASNAFSANMSLPT